LQAGFDFFAIGKGSVPGSTRTAVVNFSGYLPGGKGELDKEDGPRWESVKHPAYTPLGSMQKWRGRHSQSGFGCR
jgi:hypothetical protein